MRTTISALLALASLAVTACGGASDEPAPTQTRAQFITTSDALCKASNARTKVLNEQLTRAGAAAGSEQQLLQRLAPLLERGYGQLRDNAAALQAANPPPADARRIEQLRALYDQQSEYARKLAAAAKRGDTQQFKNLSEQQKDVVKRARRLARAYGFKVCGSAKSDAG